ncbi:IclR family transcriptional regulator [Microbacterium sp. 18062]|uniref:IclR family transcriptional regulator n=1 Tax=Microbacterium sp. 18062 TaxID=2681410 RepID=UPI001F2B92A8|nr:IclR family transcriptional regulator [Microbacterium sp. 18062]
MGEGVLQRTMRILGAFTEDAPALSAADLAARTGLALSTAHRLIAQMLAEGLLSRAPGHRYTVGARLWEIGELSPLAQRLRETALPHMVRLYEATGENVHLAVLDDPTPDAASAVFAGRLTGRASVPTLGRSGGRHPLHTTGVGKALLATRDDAWLDAYLAVPLVPETRLSITDPERLRLEVRLARRRGYATTREEMTLGNISVAAALGAVPGLPPTALGIVAHIDDSHDERRLAPLVVQAAKDLTRALRHP